MDELIKQAYDAGVNAARRDFGLTKTAAGVGFLDDIGLALSRAGRRGRDILQPARFNPETGEAIAGIVAPGATRQWGAKQLSRASNWAAENPALAGGAALGAGALGAGAAGYALAPDQKPWYHFGQ